VKRRGVGKRDLVLGWRLTTDSLEPVYLLKPQDGRGEPNDHDLVRVPAELLNHHTAIVAQSGAGKSYFIGRLIEELLMGTKARCVILDPNADFRLISRNSIAKQQKYPKELVSQISDDQIFRRCWSKITRKLYGGSDLPKKNHLKLPWAALPLEAITTEKDKPREQDELYHCHQFIKIITALLAFQHKKLGKQDYDILSKAGKVFDKVTSIVHSHPKANGAKGSDGTGEKGHGNKRTLDEKIHSEIEAQFRYKGGQNHRIKNEKNIRFSLPFLRVPIKLGTVDELVRQAVLHVQGFNSDIKDRYGARTRTYKTYGFVETMIDELVRKNKKTTKKTGLRKKLKGVSKEKDPRLEVVDLPSFKDEVVRRAALSAALALIWENAREEWSIATRANRELRAPTFIVVEEAHNLIPLQDEREDSLVKSVRERFRTIAAEGRKYGLFLIICTQRPDKIDRFVISECENIAIMKLGSPSVLDKALESFGLESAPRFLFEQCLRFTPGKALLTGPWMGAHSQVFVYGGERRIEESAKPLSSSWRVPTPEVSSEMKKFEKERARSTKRLGR
ncbi:MAG: hypothetical protein QOJ96_1192, partial [Alphaproteobacteria bacterium]|nr:hypothetical protein [Alphaproteobacteria bacterium]